ncbi:MAG: hypothetical protein DRP95_06975 [Candidatus Latescibacterota bacterium]|nr:MAG: hypothetical protein DRP95_06975 [Candidatus Latescibacterota bacterium]
MGEVDETGRRRPVPVPGSEFVVELDTLIVAIGQEPDLSFLGEECGIKISEGNTLVVDPETLATDLEGVFAGGDVVTGPKTVVDAISSGKIAAESIDRYIRGESLTREYRLTRPSMYLPPVELTEEEIEEAGRPTVPCLPPEGRAKNFEEVELTLDEEAAVREARRCLRCDLETEDGRRWLESAEGGER